MSEYGIIHNPLTDKQRAQVCGNCGHVRGRHNNPDTCCMFFGCGCKTFVDSDSIYQRAVDVFGEAAQIGQLHEEIGELMQAINKLSRSDEGTSTKSAHLHDVIEELVDLTIMCKQMMCIFDFNTQFDDMMQYKLARLEETIDATEAEQ